MQVKNYEDTEVRFHDFISGIGTDTPLSGKCVICINNEDYTNKNIGIIELIKSFLDSVSNLEAFLCCVVP